MLPLWQFFLTYEPSSFWGKLGYFLFGGFESLGQIVRSYWFFSLLLSPVAVVKPSTFYSNLALYQRLDTHCNSPKLIAVDQVTSVSFHLLFSFQVVSYPGNRGTIDGCSLLLVRLQRAPELGYLENWTVLTKTRPLVERRIYFTFCLVGERNRTGKGSKHCTEV